MDPALLAKGFTLGFVIAAAVGPISLLVIRRTLAEGRVVGLVVRAWAWPPPTRPTARSPRSG